MPNGVFALLERSLRIDARGWTTHLARLGLMRAIYLSLCFSLATQNLFGAPGLRFFEGIAHLDIAFMALLGLGFFSSVITEEKEEDTLGLMLMAGISPLGILAGKSGGRLWQALLLVAVQIPFMLLAVTMGGVATAQIWAVTVALLAYMVFLAGFGLLCSTIAPRNRTAAGLMIAGLVAYTVLPWIADTLCWFHTRWVMGGGGELVLSEFWWKVLEAIANVCVLLRMWDILATGFDQSPWSFQVVSNCTLGLICAGLSWLFFGIATRTASTESSSRGLVAKRRAFFRFNAGRPWIDPFVWKDFHFVSGGIGMMLVRTAFYGVPTVTLLIYEYVNSFPSQGFPPQDPHLEQLLVFMSFAVAVDAALVLARSMHDEVRGQTLASVVMMPRSSNGIVYSKFAGALLSWLPGPMIEMALTLNSACGRRDFWSLLTNEQGVGWIVILGYVLIPHFAALMALYARWGAVPLAIGMAFGVCIAIGVGAFFVSVAGNPQPYFWMMAFVMMGICGACHIGILLRVQALGAR